MNRTRWYENECPLCGGVLAHDNEEYTYNTYSIISNTYSILWTCCKCGARVNDIYRYTESEVYTKEEWEA